MKYLLISLILGIGVLQASDDIKSKVVKEVPTLKESTAKMYKKLHAGFEFKGYTDSPGHKAILTEIQKYYRQLKSFTSVAASMKEFPEKTFGQLTVSKDRVKKLSTYVVMDEEVKKVLDTWLKETDTFSDIVAIKEKEAEIEKIEKATKKLEKAIESKEATPVEKLDIELEKKQARLDALRKHYRLLQKQNHTIIQAGYTTPNNYYPSFNGGYYYRNGTYYPHYNQHNNCYRTYTPYRTKCYTTKPLINITYKR